MEINLRETLLEDFGIDFPISGGTGTSMENPIVMHRVVPNDFVDAEYAILRCLAIGRNVKWKLIRQELIEHGDRMFDKLKIEVIRTTELEIITTIENYYFDITECFGK